MKVTWPSTPNVVTDMVKEAEKALQDRAQELNDHRDAITMHRIFWQEIVSTTETPGWANILEMATREIEKVRTLLEQPAEEHVTNSLRGALKYLRELPNLSSLAVGQLQTADEQQEALSAELEEFVERGA